MKIGITNKEVIRLTGVKRPPTGIYAQLGISERGKQPTPTQTPISGEVTIRLILIEVCLWL